jgi:ABC-2 type transport system permease protein
MTTTLAPVRTTAPVVRRPPSRGRSLAGIVAGALRDLRRAPLTWGGGLGAMSALMAAIWPSIEDSMGELMNSYPAGLKEAFGIEELASVEQYIDAEMLSFIVPLALAFFGIRCAVRATVGAEERGHLDTVLALPLSRRVLVAGWYAATGVAMLAVLGVIWALTCVAGLLAGTDIRPLVLASGFVNVWPLAMAFTGVAFLAAGVLHRASRVTAVATGALVASYVVDLVGRLADPVEPVRVVSAFHYYGSAVNDGLDASHVGLLVAAGALLAAAGAILFDRRDIR